MKTYNYRTNLFNNTYIMITTTTIISKYNEYLNKCASLNKAIWQDIYINLINSNIKANSPVAIEKNTIAGQVIMHELPEEEKTITIEHIRNACVIAVYENNPFANHLAYIILTNPQVKNFGYASEFAKQYGQNVTNFIIQNNSIQQYQQQMNGKLPYEYDRNVFLYKNGTITETQLPTIEKKQTKIKRRT